MYRWLASSALAVSLVLVPSVAVAAVPMAPNPLPAVPPPPTVTRLPDPTGQELVRVLPPSNAVAPYTPSTGTIERYYDRIYDPPMYGPVPATSGTRTPSQNANYAVVPAYPAPAADPAKPGSWPSDSIGGRMGGLIPGLMALAGNPRSDTSVNFLLGLSMGCMIGGSEEQKRVCSTSEKALAESKKPAVPVPDDLLGTMNGNQYQFISGQPEPYAGSWSIRKPVAFDGVSTITWQRDKEWRATDYCPQPHMGVCGYALNSAAPVNAGAQVICRDASGNLRSRNGTNSYDAVGSYSSNAPGSDGPNFPFDPVTPQKMCLNSDTLVSVAWWDTTAPSTNFYARSVGLRSGQWNNPLISTVPITTISTEVACKSPAGAITKVTRSQTGTGNMVAPTCPDGTVPDSAKVSSGIGTDVSRYVPIAQTPAIPQATRDRFADCIGISAVGTQRCESYIILDGQPCTVARQECKTWVTLWEREPSRVQGMYGPYPVDASLLTALQNVYVSERGVVVDVKQPYGTALQPVDVNNTIVNVPGTSAAPITNYNYSTTVTAPQVEVFQDPDSRNVTLTDGALCFPYGWRKLNPVEWVLQPVGCALRTAFLPRQDVVKTQTAGMVAKMERLGFKPVSDKIGAAIAVIGPASSGCLGPPIAFDLMGIEVAFHPWSACEEPTKTLAGFAYALSSVTIVGAGSFALLRALGSGFGYRVSAGKGDS